MLSSIQCFEQRLGWKLCDTLANAMYNEDLDSDRTLDDAQDRVECKGDKGRGADYVFLGAM